jgi:hypothetical protein
VAKKQRRRWGLHCQNGTHTGGIQLQKAIKDPKLWHRLVMEQTKYIRRLMKTEQRTLDNIRFGDYQHPDMAGCFGCDGSRAFQLARHRWMLDIRKELQKTVLDKLAGL